MHAIAHVHVCVPSHVIVKGDVRRAVRFSDTYLAVWSRRTIVKAVKTVGLNF